MTKRTLVAFITTLLVASACNGSRVQIVDPDNLPRDLYPRAEDVVGASRQTRVNIYLVTSSRLAVVARVGRTSESGAKLLMQALLSGPTDSEMTKGITTAIPSEVELNGVSVERGVAEVDLTSQFRTAERNPFLLRIAQVVYTLTDLQPEVDSVRFLIDGRPFEVIDQNGMAQSGAVARARYSQFGPRSIAGNPVSEGPLLLDVPGAEERAEP